MGEPAFGGSADATAGVVPGTRMLVHSAFQSSTRNGLKGRSPCGRATGPNSRCRQSNWSLDEATASPTAAKSVGSQTIQSPFKIVTGPAGSGGSKRHPLASGPRSLRRSNSSTATGRSGESGIANLEGDSLGAELDTGWPSTRADSSCTPGGSVSSTSVAPWFSR